MKTKIRMRLRSLFPLEKERIMKKHFKNLETSLLFGQSFCHCLFRKPYLQRYTHKSNFIFKIFFTFQLINLQQNHHRENYKLIELAAKLKELILNHKDGDDNNLNWKHSELTNYIRTETDRKQKQQTDNKAPIHSGNIM